MAHMEDRSPMVIGQTKVWMIDTHIPKWNACIVVWGCSKSCTKGAVTQTHMDKRLVPLSFPRFAERQQVKKIIVEPPSVKQGYHPPKLAKMSIVVNQSTFARNAWRNLQWPPVYDKGMLQVKKGVLKINNWLKFITFFPNAFLPKFVSASTSTQCTV